jgi:hypothetical protein
VRSIAAAPAVYPAFRRGRAVDVVAYGLVSIFWRLNAGGAGDPEGVHRGPNIHVNRPRRPMRGCRVTAWNG